MLDAESLQGWGQYLKLGLPMCVMTCSEWWAFEILIILAGRISVRDQATYIILISLSNQMYEVAKGLGEATCALIGNSVGSNDVKLANNYFRVTFTISLIVVTTISVIVLRTSESIITLFTNEKDVYRLTLSVIPIVCLKSIWDGMQGYA